MEIKTKPLDVEGNSLLKNLVKSSSQGLGLGTALGIPSAASIQVDWRLDKFTIPS